MPLGTFVLAVDVGTSRTAAATARHAVDGSIVATPFALGRRSDSVATVVYVADDGDLVFGDAAERRGIAHPERLIREFKRDVGDGIPVVVGGRSLPAEELYAQSLAAVVEAVTEREGERPSLVSVTHPTAWGPHRLGLIEAALARHGIDEIALVTEPEAAARHYEATRPLDQGCTLAVYDLGGGTFDAVVLRKGVDGDFAVIGEAVGIDDLGGADFDDAVFQHALSSSGVDVAAISVDDADVRIALAQLRREAVDAKEALSFDGDVAIPVLLPSARASVRLTRSEFEHMIDDDLERSIDAFGDALVSAGVAPEQLEAILLIGGSSRIPLVAQRLSERFDRPLAVDADPKAAIALGAARTALARVDAAAAVAIAPLAFDDVLADAGGRGPALAGAARGPRARPEHAVRRRAPLLLGTTAVVVAGSLVWGGTLAAATWMRGADEGDSGAGIAQASEPLAPAADPPPARATETKTPAATPAPAVPVAQAAPEEETDRRSSQRPASKIPTRSEEPAPRSTPKAPAPSAPASSGGSGSTATTPTGGTPTDPPADPTDPPVDPTDPPTDPTDPPVDPTDPPVDPTPTDPPVDPTPTDPPVDPTPTDPPADPTPTDPPADPTPTDPPADPTPTDPPVGGE